MSVNYLMILSDGETFTSVSGCKIVRVDEETAPDDHLSGLESGYVNSVASAACEGDAPGIELVAEFDEDEEHGVIFREELPSPHWTTLLES